MQTPEIPRYDIVFTNDFTTGVPDLTGPWCRFTDVEAAFAALPTGTLTDDDIDRIRRALLDGAGVGRRHL